MVFINVTPHDIVYVENGKEKVFEASGRVARVREVEKEVDRIGGYRTVEVSGSTVEGIGRQEEGLMYIVSGVVLEALKGVRDDVVAPNTGPESVLRNEFGHVVGVRSFKRSM